MPESQKAKGNKKPDKRPARSRYSSSGRKQKNKARRQAKERRRQERLRERQLFLAASGKLVRVETKDGRDKFIKPDQVKGFAKPQKEKDVGEGQPAEPGMVPPQGNMCDDHQSAG